MDIDKNLVQKRIDEMRERVDSAKKDGKDSLVIVLKKNIKKLEELLNK